MSMPATFLVLMAVAVVAVLVALSINAKRSMGEDGQWKPARKPSSSNDEFLAQTILNAEIQTPSQADTGWYDDQPAHHHTTTSHDHHHTPHFDGGSNGHHDSGSGGHHSD